MPGEFVDVPENQPGDHDRPGADDDHNGAEIPDAPITAARTGVGTPD